MKLFRSFRVRLTVINALVVLGLLALSGALLGYTTRTFTMSALERELQARADGIVHRPPLNGLDRPLGPPPGSPDDPGRPRVYNQNLEPMDGRDDSPPLDRAALKAGLSGPVFSIVKSGEDRIRVFTTPIPRPGSPAGVVQIGHNLNDYDRLIAAQNQILFSLAPLALLVAAAAGWFLSQRALGPVDAVTKAASAISAEAIETRLDVSGDDELARLATTFNAMLDRLGLAFHEKEAALRSLEVALERQKQFVGDASHELRTPLTRLKLVTSAALDQTSSPEELRRALQVADEATDSVVRLVQQLLALARMDDQAFAEGKTSVSLATVAKEAVAPFESESGAPIRLVTNQDLPVLAREDDLVRALGNLLQNARRHTPPDGCITVSVDGRAISVEDTGSGIPAEHLPRVTERFYRADSARSRQDGGCGLGLAITRGIVEAFDGTLKLESQPGQGTRVTMSFLDPQAPLA